MTKTAASKTQKKTSTSKPTVVNIEKVAVDTLKLLQTLGIEQQLQSDIDWCIGSYRFDNNPTGLYEMTEKALAVLKNERLKKTKGVTAKLVGDLEKVLKSK
jgi:hypothetical protein